MKNKICVLGGGSWGATIASHIAKKGLEVSLWEFMASQAEQMKKTRRLSFLPKLKIPDSIFVTSKMDEALRNADTVFSIIPSQFVRSTWNHVRKLSPKPFRLIVSFTKGIENKSMKTMSQVIRDEFPESEGKIAVLSGPSHAEEVAKEVPTAVVAASEKKSLAEKTQKILSTDSFRVYTNPDMIGVEFCGAVKNIYAIACGACDGLGLGDNTKSALITRGLSEMMRLGHFIGIKKITLFGLAGIGDLMVTCFSKHSRNRLLGEKIGEGKSVAEALKEMTMVAEGYPTSKSAYQLLQKYSCEAPILTELYRVLFESKNVRGSIRNLMTRPLRSEHEELSWK